MVTTYTVYYSMELYRENCRKIRFFTFQVNILYEHCHNIDLEQNKLVVSLQYIESPILGPLADNIKDVCRYVSG